MKFDAKTIAIVVLAFFLIFKSGGETPPGPGPEPQPNPVVVFDQDVIDAVVKADIVYNLLLHEQLSNFDAPDTEVEAWKEIGEIYKAVNSAAYDPLNDLWMAELKNNPNRDDDDEEYSPQKFEQFLKSVAEGHKRTSEK